ncbi:MAG: metallophosphoesterase family protein [Spirochaetaceae bacterium]
MRVAQISDLHLSRDHAYFYQNWRVVLDRVNETQPDLVVVGGDVSFNGADSLRDLEFARSEIDRIEAPTVVIPGNHDIGDHPRSRKLDQPVDARRMDRWLDVFETDRFSVELDGLRIVGMNTELLGSGLPREEEQWGWLESELAPGSAPGVAPGAPRTLFFMHKPLFARSPDEKEFNKSCVDPPSRARLWSLFERATVPTVASAHVHVYKHIRARGIDFVWCPATSFVVGWEGKDVFDGIRRAGYIEYDTGGADDTSPAVSHAWIEPDLLVNYDLRNWFVHHGSTVGLPPLPLASP